MVHGSLTKVCTDLGYEFSLEGWMAEADLTMKKWRADTDAFIAFCREGIEVCDKETRD